MPCQKRNVFEVADGKFQYEAIQAGGKEQRGVEPRLLNKKAIYLPRGPIHSFLGPVAVVVVSQISASQHFMVVQAAWHFPRAVDMESKAGETAMNDVRPVNAENMARDRLRGAKGRH